MSRLSRILSGLTSRAADKSERGRSTASTPCAKAKRSVTPRVERLESRLAPADLSIGTNARVVTDFIGPGEGPANGALQSDGKMTTIPISHVSSLTIHDGDDGPPGDLILGDANYSALEGKGRVVIPIFRINGSAGRIEVQYSLTAGTAQQGSDFQSNAVGSLTFEDRVTSTNLEIGIVNDSDVEPDETFVIQILSPVGGAGLGSTTSTTVTIYDDDAVNLVRDLSFNSGLPLAQTLFGSLADTVSASAVHADGKVLAAGPGTAATGLKLARYNADGSLDSTFGNGGTKLIDVGNVLGSARSFQPNTLLLRDNGKFLVVELGSQAFGAGPQATLLGFNPDGTIDFTFGSGGVLALPEIPGTSPYGGGRLSQDSSGRFLLANSDDNGFVLQCHRADGTLDDSFGVGGTVRTDLGGSSSFSNSLYGLILQPDGKILAIGAVSGASGSVYHLVRFNPDGSLDNSFAGDGITTADFTGYATGALGRNGQIVLAGSTAPGADGSRDLLLQRFHADGGKDLSFGASGRAVFDLDYYDFASQVVVLDDGNIVVQAGALPQSGGVNHSVLLRLSSTGGLDDTFDGDGRLNLATDGSVVSSVYSLSGGKLLLVGTQAGVASTRSDFEIQRLNDDGSLDITYDGDGKVATDFIGQLPIHLVGAIAQSSGEAVAVSADGGITTFRFLSSGRLDSTYGAHGVTAVGGNTSSTYFVRHGDALLAPIRLTADNAIPLVRIGPDGELDNAFGANGAAAIALPADVSYDFTGSILPLDDGKILSIGALSSATGLQSYFARFNANGGPDPTFGSGGVVTSEAPSSLHGAVLVGGGKFVTVSLDTATGFPSKVLLKRYNADGSFDISFRPATDTPKAAFLTGSPMRTADGKILVQGNFGETYSSSDITLARFNLDGTVDASFGLNGLAKIDLGGTDALMSLALQSDGKFLAAARSDNGNHRTVLLRFNANGLLDATFGQGGVVTIDVSDSASSSAVAILPDGNYLFLEEVKAGNGEGIALSRFLSAADSGAAPSFGEFVFSSASYSANEVTGTATITVTRNNGSDGAVTVNYFTSNSSATAGSDYTPASGTLEFAAGDTSKIFTISIMDDAVVEAVEFIGLSLSTPTGGAILGALKNAVLSIRDNDAPSTQPGTVQFASAAPTTGEGAGTVLLSVTRTNGTDGPVTVDYATGGGTATADGDYKASTGTLTFGPGVMTQAITIVLIDDAVVEGNESFNVTLSNLKGGATLGGASTAGVFLADDDKAPAGVTIQFSAATFRVREDASKLALTVTRSGSADRSASVDFALGEGGTAAANSDFKLSAGTLNFAAGETSKAIAVALVSDTVKEGDETFVMTLSSSTGATLGATTTATVTILDVVKGDTKKFVDNVYSDLLGRLPDDAGKAALQQAVEAARNTALTITATQYLTALETRTKLVQGYYRQFLRRATREDEARFWTNSFEHAVTPEGLIANLLASDTYFQDAGSDNARWLEWAYQDLLGHGVDEVGRVLVADLSAGAKTRMDIALALVAGAEYQGLLIAQTYQLLLGRAPAQAETDFWRIALSEKPQGFGVPSPHELFKIGVLASNEYFTKNGGTVTTWMTAFYRDFLNRAPDDLGLEFGVNNTLNGYRTQREDVARTVLASDEAKIKTVTDLFRQYLDRAPTADDLKFWVGLLKIGVSTEQVIAGVLASAECFQQAGGDNTKWLDNLYRTLLGRERDDGSRPFELALSIGIAREEVVRVILASTEYRALLIAGCYTTYLKQDALKPQIDFLLDAFTRGATREDVLSLLLSTGDYV